MKLGSHQTPFSANILFMHKCKFLFGKCVNKINYDSYQETEVVFLCLHKWIRKIDLPDEIIIII